MSPSTAIRVYANTLTPLLRLPLILADLTALPFSVLCFNIQGMVFTSLSLPFAVIDLLIWLSRWSHHRTPIAESPISVSKLCMFVDLILSIGSLVTWLIAVLVADDHRTFIASFALFCVWLCHTLHLFASIFIWTYTTRKQHVCHHCGHRPESVLGTRAATTAVGRDSDEATAYDEAAEQDAEDAMLLKPDVEA